MKEISNEFLLQRRQWASFLTLTFLSQDSRLQSLSRSSLDSSSCPSHHFLRVSGSVSSSEADDQWKWFLSEDFIGDFKERDRLQSNCTLWRLLPWLTPLIAGLDKVIGNYPQNENKSDPSCFIVLLIHSGERWLEAPRLPVHWHCAVDTVDLGEYVTSSPLTMRRQETSCSGSDEISSRLNSIFGHRKLSISFLLTAVKLRTVTWLWPHCTPLNCYELGDKFSFQRAVKMFMGTKLERGLRNEYLRRSSGRDH